MYITCISSLIHLYYYLPPLPLSLSLSQEEDAYTTVRHGPRYVPKQDQGGGRGGESPPPAKPRRTDRPADYDTTAMFRKQESSERVDGGGGGGLEELDNLLEMLSTTQQQQTGKEGREGELGRGGNGNNGRYSLTTSLTNCLYFGSSIFCLSLSPLSLFSLYY